MQDVTDEEREQAGSPVAEVTTSKQRSSLREASLAEEDLPELVEHHDAPEEVSQSEEELMDSEPANQSPEPPQEEEEEEDDDNYDALSAGDFHMFYVFILLFVFSNQFDFEYIYI